MSDRNSKFLPIVLFVAGLVLVVLGLEGRFTFVSCGTGHPTLCINVYTFDVVAILIGAIAIIGGFHVYRRTL